MGIIGTLIEWFRTTDEDVPVTDVKIDQGGDDNLTGELFQPAGFDAQALPGDLVLGVRLPGSGRFAIIGFLDPVNQNTTEAGETRMYARDGDGAIVGSIRIQNDGTVNLGEDVGAQLMARADRTEEQINRIWDLLQNWPVSPMDGGLALQQQAILLVAFQGDATDKTGADKVRGT